MENLKRLIISGIFIMFVFSLLACDDKKDYEKKYDIKYDQNMKIYIGENRLTRKRYQKVSATPFRAVARASCERLSRRARRDSPSRLDHQGRLAPEWGALRGGRIRSEAVR